MRNTLQQPWFVLVLFAIAAYTWGVVSFQHYIPAGTDFFVSLYSATILAIGLFCFFLRTVTKSISYTTILWFSASLLFFLQPIFHEVYYIDDLLLSFLTIILCGFFAWAVSLFDKNQKKRAVLFFAWSMFFSGIFTAISQLAQLLHWDFLYQVLFFKVASNRLTGNIGQANQAAFVLVLTVASMIYLLQEYKDNNFTKKNKWLLFVLINVVVVLLTFGMALTISRGGILLLACTFLGGAVLYKGGIRNRILALIGFVPASIVGYFWGSAAIQSFNNNTMSAAGRLVGETESLGLRQALLEQAWLAFKSSPITGIGWDNLKNFGLQQAEQLDWFTVANHSHNIVAQIAAEFGILGLAIFGSFGWLIVRNVRLSLPNYQAFSFIVLGLLFAYSLSEYPLWYFRFLLLTVFFAAIIDGSKKYIAINYSKFLSIISLLFVLGGGYYIYQYYHYVAVSYMIQSDETSYEQEIEAYQGLPNVFGYSKYKELIFYMLNPVSNENLDVQIQLGDRVLSTYLDSFLMLKQANLLILADREQEADRLLRAVCIFTTHTNKGQYCSLAVGFLEDLIKQNPSYQGYLDRLSAWHEQYYHKPLPTGTKDEYNSYG